MCAKLNTQNENRQHCVSNGIEILAQNSETPTARLVANASMESIEQEECAMEDEQLTPKCNPIMERIKRDLNSPSAMLRVRALKALKSPSKSDYAVFDIPHEEQSLITAEDRCTPPAPLTLHEIMKDVRIYVEVRSPDMNRTQHIKEFIRSKGIIVHNKLSKNTTHVIFREGLQSTYDKAKEWNIPIVSILWLEDCRKKRKICDPKDYIIYEIDEYENPELYEKPKRYRPKILDGDRVRRPRTKQTNATAQDANKTATPTEKSNKKLSQIGSSNKNKTTKLNSTLTQKTEIRHFFKPLTSPTNIKITPRKTNGVKVFDMLKETYRTERSSSNSKWNSNGMSTQQQGTVNLLVTNTIRKSLSVKTKSTTPVAAAATKQMSVRKYLNFDGSVSVEAAAAAKHKTGAQKNEVKMQAAAAPLTVAATTANSAQTAPAKFTSSAAADDHLEGECLNYNLFETEEQLNEELAAKNNVDNSDAEELTDVTLVSNLQQEEVEKEEQLPVAKRNSRRSKSATTTESAGRFKCRGRRTMSHAEYTSATTINAKIQLHMLEESTTTKEKRSPERKTKADVEQKEKATKKQATDTVELAATQHASPKKKRRTHHGRSLAANNNMLEETTATTAAVAQSIYGGDMSLANDFSRLAVHGSKSQQQHAEQEKAAKVSNRAARSARRATLFLTTTTADAAEAQNKRRQSRRRTTYINQTIDVTEMQSASNAEQQQNAATLYHAETMLEEAAQQQQQQAADDAKTLLPDRAADISVAETNNNSIVNLKNLTLADVANQTAAFYSPCSMQKVVNSTFLPSPATQSTPNPLQQQRHDALLAAQKLEARKPYTLYDVSMEILNHNVQNINNSMQANKQTPKAAISALEMRYHTLAVNKSAVTVKPYHTTPNLPSQLKRANDHKNLVSDVVNDIVANSALKANSKITTIADNDETCSNNMLINNDSKVELNVKKSKENAANSTAVTAQLAAVTAQTTTSKAQANAALTTSLKAQATTATETSKAHTKIAAISATQATKAVTASAAAQETKAASEALQQPRIIRKRQLFTPNSYLYIKPTFSADLAASKPASPSANKRRRTLAAAQASNEKLGENETTKAAAAENNITKQQTKRRRTLAAQSTAADKKAAPVASEATTKETLKTTKAVDVNNAVKLNSAAVNNMFATTAASSNMAIPRQSVTDVHGENLAKSETSQITVGLSPAAIAIGQETAGNAERPKHRRSTMYFETQRHRRPNYMSAAVKLADEDDKRPPMVLVCTNMRQEHVETLREAVETLGVFTLAENVSNATTHVVSKETARTLNLLRALVRGVWILDFKWIVESMSAGKWIDEENYELTGFSHAVKICRAERQAFGNAYKCELFSSLGAFYVSSHCGVPSRKHLEELIRLCGGCVVNDRCDAKYIIGGGAVRRYSEGRIHLTPFWIVDSITQMSLLRLTRYTIVSEFTSDLLDQAHGNNDAQNNVAAARSDTQFVYPI